MVAVEKSIISAGERCWKRDGRLGGGERGCYQYGQGPSGTCVLIVLTCGVAATEVLQSLIALTIELHGLRW